MKNALLPFCVLVCMYSAHAWAAPDTTKKQCRILDVKPVPQRIAFSGKTPAIHLHAPDDYQDHLCYNLHVQVGSRVTVKITGRNVAFTIEDLGDMRTHNQFVARKPVYEMIVSEVIRTEDTETFRMEITARPDHIAAPGQQP